MPDPVDDLDHVGPWLALHIKQHRRGLVGPCSKPHVLRTNFHHGNVAEPQRRLVPVGQHQVEIIVGRLELVVGVDGRRAQRAVQRSFRLVDVGRHDCRAQFGHRQASRSQCLRIGLDANRRPLAALDRHKPDPGHLGKFLGDPRVDQIANLGQRHRCRRNRQGHHRRICRVDLVVNGWNRQIFRQQAEGSVDRGLDLLLRHIERKLKDELERNH